MNRRLRLIILIFILVSCGQKNTSDKVAVLMNQFGNESFRYGNLKTWEPNKSEINFTEKFILEIIKKHKEDYGVKEIYANFNDYYYQFIPYLDENNRKIIYVNSFCKDFIQNPFQDLTSEEIEKEIEWKSHFFDVNDGGNCFWKVQVDVEKKDYFDFSVNGF
ncbi:MAG: hypothetical protein WA749_03230 [Gelidibacter sp.]